MYRSLPERTRFFTLAAVRVTLRRPAQASTRIVQRTCRPRTAAGLQVSAGTEMEFMPILALVMHPRRVIEHRHGMSEMRVRHVLAFLFP